MMCINPDSALKMTPVTGYVQIVMVFMTNKKLYGQITDIHHTEDDAVINILCNQ